VLNYKNKGKLLNYKEKEEAAKPQELRGNCYISRIKGK
jgi:hypothetical protein